jgi:hypothetical protein
MAKQANESRRGYVAILVVAGVLMAAWFVMGLRRNELSVPGAQVVAKVVASATDTEPESPIMNEATLEANAEAKWKGVQEAEAAQETARAKPQGSKEVPTRT